jgi:hypothetical protein
MLNRLDGCSSTITDDVLKLKVGRAHMQNRSLRMPLFETLDEPIVRAPTVVR